MNIETESYIALSALSYSNLEGFIGKTIAELISNENRKNIKGYTDDNGKIKPEFQALSTMLDWKLINASSSSSGFAGAAFQSPSGEIVFALRGTEKDEIQKRNGVLPEDILQDLHLATGNGDFGQFGDAELFVARTMGVDSFSEAVNIIANRNNDSNATNDVSVTGHSLGGGIAQWITYASDRAIGGQTFNAVGIGQIIEESGRSIDYIFYRGIITDYVNADDIVGNYGKQLGDTVYLQRNLDNTNVDIPKIVSLINELSRLENLTIVDDIHLIKKFSGDNIKNHFSQSSPETYNYFNDQMLFKAHMLSDLMHKNGDQWVMKSSVSTSDSADICVALFDKLTAAKNNTDTYIAIAEKVFKLSPTNAAAKNL